MQDIPRRVPRLPTRSGKRWIASTLTGILHNPRYAGWSMLHGEIVRQPDGKPVQGNWEQIVSDDLWLRVQKRLDDPSRIRNRVGTDRRHLGSGLYLCGVCENKVISHGSRYRCSRQCLVRTREVVDYYVQSVIEERLARPDLRDLLVVAPDDTAAAAVLDGEVATQRGRILRARADYASEKIEADLYAEIRQHAQSLIAAAESDRLALTATSPAAVDVMTAGDPVAAFQGADLMSRRAIIDVFCEIRLHPSPRGRRAFDTDTVQVTWR